MRGECERDHLGQGLSGEWAGVCPHPGRRLSLALSRGGRCRARRPTPGGCPRFPQADGCSALRGLRHRVKPIGAGDPSNGADDSFAVKARRLGRSLWSRPFGMAHAPP